MHLTARRAGDYDRAATQLSPRFKRAFKHKKGLDYANYFMTQSETDFHESEIVTIECRRERVVVAMRTQLEEPGVLSYAEERFTLRRFNRAWLIDDWQIIDQ